MHVNRSFGKLQPQLELGFALSVSTYMVDSVRRPGKGPIVPSTTRLLIVGLIFHLVYMGSVFDCYFTSPVVNGMRRYNVGTALARRLVLIVGA